MLDIAVDRLIDSDMAQSSESQHKGSTPFLSSPMVSEEFEG